MGISTTISNFRNTEFTNGFKPGCCRSIFSFLCSVLEIIACHYVLFSFGHCIAGPSIYGSWLFLWYLQTFFTRVFKIKIKVGAFLYWMSSRKCTTQSYIYKLKLLFIPPAASKLQPLPLSNHNCRIQTLFYILALNIYQIVA